MPIFEFEIIEKRKGIVRIEADSKLEAKKLAEQASLSKKYLNVDESLERIELLRTLEPEKINSSEHRHIIGKKNPEIEKYIRYNFINDKKKPVYPSPIPANDVAALIIYANGIKARFREYQNCALYELL